MGGVHPQITLCQPGVYRNRVAPSGKDRTSGDLLRRGGAAARNTSQGYGPVLILRQRGGFVVCERFRHGASEASSTPESVTAGRKRVWPDKPRLVRGSVL